jgi:hypothetical protein
LNILDLNFFQCLSLYFCFAILFAYILEPLHGRNLNVYLQYWLFLITCRDYLLLKIIELNFSPFALNLYIQVKNLKIRHVALTHSLIQVQI